KRAAEIRGAPGITAVSAGSSADAPVDPELAFLGEAVVDALDPILVRTASGLVPLGEDPGAQGVAHPRQGRHVPGERHHGLLVGLDEDVLDRTVQLDLDL